jgi:predicted dithiol-disulfide oxidoreductase (DUF899 family)
MTEPRKLLILVGSRRRAGISARSPGPRLRVVRGIGNGPGAVTRDPGNPLLGADQFGREIFEKNIPTSESIPNESVRDDLRVSLPGTFQDPTATSLSILGAAIRRSFEEKSSTTNSQDKAMETTDKAITSRQIVSREEWTAARKELLRKEKELTRLRDQLAAERRALPWVKIEKDYVFDAPKGKVTLRDLFDGRSQLFIKHFMMAPGQVGQCVGCSLEVDHLEGILVHLQNRDVTYAAVARAPIEEIEVVRERMGWQFPWVSSYDSDFNYDFNVSFRPEQVASRRALYNYQEAPAWAADLQDLSGDSVFFKDNAGQIFHTYSAFGRGGEEFLGIYRYLDATPKGRDENGPYHTLADWVRPRNLYGQGGVVEANGRYHQPGCACAVH